MDIPTPQPALVIRYAYLWADEHDSGREEGAKDRPAAVILALTNPDDTLKVVVLPITHTAPSDKTDAIEIPPDTKRRLGLDDARSWIVLTEANVFLWPGPDIRAVPGSDPETAAYGYLPAGFFRTVRDRFVATVRDRRLRQVPRTE